MTAFGACSKIDQARAASAALCGPSPADELFRTVSAYYVGDIELFYCEAPAYIENLKRAGIDAHVDVDPGRFRTYDLYFLFIKEGKGRFRLLRSAFAKRWDGDDRVASWFKAEAEGAAPPAGPGRR